MGVIDRQARLSTSTTCAGKSHGGGQGPFPLSLATIGNIQAEILQRHGREKVGDYGLFASRAANLFMHPGLYAFDEYGVPLETARRLAALSGVIATLDGH